MFINVLLDDYLWLVEIGMNFIFFFWLSCALQIFYTKDILLPHTRRNDKWKY